MRLPKPVGRFWLVFEDHCWRFSTPFALMIGGKMVIEAFVLEQNDFALFDSGKTFKMLKLLSVFGIHFFCDSLDSIFVIR